MTRKQIGNASRTGLAEIDGTWVRRSAATAHATPGATIVDSAAAMTRCRLRWRRRASSMSIFRLRGVRGSRAQIGRIIGVTA